MNQDRMTFLKELMKWYWETGNPENLITKSDYEFLYDLWNHSLSYYGTEVQDRLNKIRTIYIDSIKNSKKTE